MLVAWILFSIPLLIAGMALAHCKMGTEEENALDFIWAVVFFLCPFWAIYFLIRHFLN